MRKREKERKKNIQIVETSFYFYVYVCVFEPIKMAIQSDFILKLILIGFEINREFYFYYNLLFYRQVYLAAEQIITGRYLIFIFFIIDIFIYRSFNTKI